MVSFYAGNTVKFDAIRVCFGIVFCLSSQNHERPSLSDVFERPRNRAVVNLIEVGTRMSGLFRCHADIVVEVSCISQRTLA